MTFVIPGLQRYIEPKKQTIFFGELKILLGWGRGGGWFRNTLPDLGLLPKR